MQIIFYEVVYGNGKLLTYKSAKANGIKPRAEMRFYSIYKQIADKHGVKCKTVTRSMSYAISQARHVCSNLSELIGLKFQKPDVYNSSVIAYLGTYLKYCGQ